VSNRQGPARPAILRKHYALPQEHGAWIWWIGPLLIGMAAGGRPDGRLLLFSLSVLAAFLARQPASIWVKVRSGRRPARDQAPAAFWLALYSSAALGSLAALILDGATYLLLLALPGVPVFLWHLWLVARRQERGRLGTELVISGVLALTAPAAYWLSAGQGQITAWILWLLTWLQSAASIVSVAYRLKMRKMAQAPPLGRRLRMAARGLAYHGFNLGLSAALAAMRLAPWGTLIAFGLTAVEALEGVLRPPVGVRPTRIGLRQLGVSSLFVVLMALAYWRR